MNRAIAERYQVERKLGEGGFGTVHLAFDIKNQRSVALKLLKPGPDGQDIGRVSRFLREARAIAKLQNPHIVQLFDFGHSESGEFFMACEYVEGADLAEICESRPFSQAHARRLLFEMLLALDEAHSMGLLHRDIKPQNIRIKTDGAAKLLDFGLVQQTNGVETGLTGTGQVIGTPRYMSPEQLAGTELEPATDIYSLGLTVAEALIGKESFRRNHVRAGLVNAGVGAALTQILTRMCELDINRRYATATAVLSDLRPPSTTTEPELRPAPDDDVAGSTIVAEVQTAPEVVERWRLWWIAPLVALVALALGVVVLSRDEPPAPRRPEPRASISAVERLNKPADPEVPTPAPVGPCERADRYEPADSVTLTSGLVQRTIEIHVPEGVPVGHRMPLVLSSRPVDTLLETSRIHHAIILPHIQFKDRASLGEVVDALKQRFCIGVVVRIGGMPRYQHEVENDHEACLLADASVSDSSRRCFPTHSVKVIPEYGSGRWLESVASATYDGACRRRSRPRDECEPQVEVGKCARSTCSESQLYCKVASDWKIPKTDMFCGQVPENIWSEALGFLLESWATREDTTVIQGRDAGGTHD